MATRLSDFRCKACAKRIPEKRARLALARGKVPATCGERCQNRLKARRHRVRVAAVKAASAAPTGMLA